MSLKTKLKKLNKKWAEAREEFGDETSGFETVPSGNYVVGKLKCEIAESTQSGKLQVKRNVTILEGEFKGQKVFDNLQLETERGPEFLLKWLNFMEYEVENLDDLEETLEEISANEDATFQVRVKSTEDGFSNIYFNKILEDGSSEEEGEEGEEEGEEEEGEEEEEDLSLDEMSRKELKAYIEENELDIKVTRKMDDDEIRDLIEEAVSKEEGEEEEGEEEGEEEEVEEEPAPKKGRKSKDTKLLVGLKDLCDGFGIQYEQDVTLKDLKETLKEYELKRKDMSKDEIELLKEAGLGKSIK